MKNMFRGFAKNEDIIVLLKKGVYSNWYLRNRLNGLQKNLHGKKLVVDFNGAVLYPDTMVNVCGYSNGTIVMKNGTILC